jgi:hypothetical protein
VKNLTAPQRNAIAKGFSALTRNVYHESIPLASLNAVLATQGLLLLQEDGTAYSGIFCGREGSAKLQIGTVASATRAHWSAAVQVFEPVQNSLLILTWYKISTKYEIVAYMS